MSNAVPDDYELNRTNIYSAHWAGQNARRGSTTKEERLQRQEDAGKVSDDYYNLVSPIYEGGWGQTFHYCPLTPGLSISQSMTKYDQMFAELVGLKKGMKVLDVGCGIGGPARTIAKQIGCEITGITRNEWHIERGRALTKEAGLENLVTHLQADFLAMPFEDETFDAVYAFDALCYATSLPAVYSEIHRVLKPGGPFGFSDWIMTEKFDEANKVHRFWRNQIEFGNGITKMPLLSEVHEGLKETGFVTRLEENMAHRSAPGPWYYGPAGDTTYCVDWEDWWKVFKMSPGYLRTQRVIFQILVWLHILPKEVISMMDTMWYCTRSAAKGGELGIFTPMWVTVSGKPSKSQGKGHRKSN